jgi:hypothetical protein
VTTPLRRRGQYHLQVALNITIYWMLGAGGRDHGGSRYRDLSVKENYVEWRPRHSDTTHYTTHSETKIASAVLVFEWYRTTHY